MPKFNGDADFEVCRKVEGTNINILDTRKNDSAVSRSRERGGTTWWRRKSSIRFVRLIMIKDNHVDFAGGIPQAIERVNDYLREKNLDLKIEIETRNISEVQQVLETGHVHRIMLDNFKPIDVSEAVKKIGGKYEIEISGGVTLDNISDYAIEGVDFISVGSITHSYKSLDLSLKAEF